MSTRRDDIDRLLAGADPGQDDALAYLATLRRALVTSPPEDVAERHLAAITAAAQQAAHRPPAAPAPKRQALRGWTRRVAAAGGLKLAASATAVLAATGGGLAATGNLPDPAQRAVAEVLDEVGLTVPKPPADRVPQTTGTEEPTGASDRGPSAPPSTPAPQAPGRRGEVPRSDPQRPSTVTQRPSTATQPPTTDPTRPSVNRGTDQRSGGPQAGPTAEATSTPGPPEDVAPDQPPADGSSNRPQAPAGAGGVQDGAPHPTGHDSARSDLSSPGGPRPEGPGTG
ncbi:MAG: hypothetical protein KY462_02735 [Actinobacteria bacterium]|nr:hypothetical protein [Actinomycetota bacterium]